MFYYFPKIRSFCKIRCFVCLISANFPFFKNCAFKICINFLEVKLHISATLDSVNFLDINVHACYFSSTLIT